MYQESVQIYKFLRFRSYKSYFYFFIYGYFSINMIECWGHHEKYKLIYEKKVVKVWEIFFKNVLE